MKNLVIGALLLTSNYILSQDRIDGLNVLTDYMIGSFNSSAQAEQDTNYLNIRLDMHRIWNDRTDGVWLYVEQAINKKEAKPYRQRVYHVEMINENTFSSSIFKLDSSNLYIGLHKNKTVENLLKFDNIELLPGCALKLSYDGNAFKGATEKGACLNNWGDAAYATSEVEIYSDKMLSWDRGWNEKDEYVWGAEKAGYLFIKY